MKCDELQQRLDDYLEGDLDTILVFMLEQHITLCKNCASTVSFARSVQSELKQMQSPKLSDEFIDSAFRNVRSSYPENRTENQIQSLFSNVKLQTGFVTAIAAGFALWAVLSTFILPGFDSSPTVNNADIIASLNQTIKSEPTTIISSLKLKLDESKVVRIAIDTPDSFENVTFSVLLPKHIELKGHKNKRKISWQSKLAKGNNILRIPLTAVSYGQGELIARVTHNGKVKTFKLFLESNKLDSQKIDTERLKINNLDIIKPNLPHSTEIELQV